MVQTDPICGMQVNEDTKFKADVRGTRFYFCSERCMSAFLEGPNIAYFSMEIGIRSDIPTYSGGLGVLAGDTIRSSADIQVPLVGLTLVSRKGYLRQKLMPDGEQVESPDKWDPAGYMKLLPDTVNVPIDGRKVKVAAWIYEQESPTGGRVPVLFLDTDVMENQPEDRGITDYLYGGDSLYRLKQEVVLGIGGMRMLDVLGFKIRKYHMNEGHSSLLILELLKKNKGKAAETRDQCIFTTHTPVAAAFDIFSYDTVERMLGGEFDIKPIKEYAGREGLNMTMLALNLSKFVNGVANTHMAASRKLFPGYHIRAVTNGVYSPLWTCQPFKDIYDKYIPGWANEPELLVRAEVIPDAEIWQAHEKAKRSTIEYINHMADAGMEDDVLTLGFARRATAYKRSTLLFSNIKRLLEINESGKLQVVFAGKAHPRDRIGKDMIKEIFAYVKQLKGKIAMAYLENYDMDMAAALTSGCDVWLTTPTIPYEASGTSGMKAAHNGVLNFSVLDGWWVEGCIEGVTGWAIGPSPDIYLSDEERKRREIKDMYNKLEYLIAPLYYKNRDLWIDMMKESIGKIAYYFNTHRMMRRYATEAYL